MLERTVGSAHGAVGFAERRAAIAGLAIAVAVGWNISNVSAVATELAKAYRLSLFSVGLLTTEVILVAIIFQVPTGRSADRYGPRRVGLVGLALLGSASLVTLAVNAPLLAFVARGIVGVGVALAFVTGVDYVRRMGGSPLALGVYGGMNGVGAGLALALVPQLDVWLGWRAAFLSGAVIALGAFVALLVGPPDLDWQATSASAAKPQFALALIRDRRFVRLSVMMLGSNGVSPAIGVWVAPLLVRAGGYSPGAAGAIGSLTLFGWVITRPVGAWLIHKRPDLMQRTLVLSIVMGTAGTLGLAVGHPVALAIAGSALVGVAPGLPWTYGFIAAAEMCPASPGTTIALLNMTGMIALAAAVQLVGLSFSAPGDGRVGFVALAVVWAASIAMVPGPRGAAPRISVN